MEFIESKYHGIGMTVKVKEGAAENEYFKKPMQAMIGNSYVVLDHDEIDEMCLLDAGELGSWWFSKNDLEFQDDDPKNDHEEDVEKQKNVYFEENKKFLDENGRDQISFYTNKAYAYLDSERRHFEFSKGGIKTNVRTWFENKSWLFEMFRKHPMWNEELKSIIIQTEIMNEFDANTFERMFRAIFRNSELNLDFDEASELIYQFDRLSRWIQESGKLEVDGSIPSFSSIPDLEFKKGQKISRALGSWFRKRGFDKYSFYERRFAEISDVLSTKTVKRSIVFSLNFLDYITMSNGNSWDSCHSLTGCYKAGTLSYANDASTIVCYSVKDGCEASSSLMTYPKITRQVFFVGESFDRFIQSRMYPNNDDKTLRDKYRKEFQRILSLRSEKENLWIYKMNDSENLRDHSDGLHYNDCGHGFTHVGCTRKGSEKERIVVGYQAYCLDSGDELYEADELNCECLECGECGCRLSSEDSYVINDNHYCEDCVTYCHHCGDRVPNSDWNSEHDICQSCLDNDFFICDDCDELHSNDETNYVDGKTVCSSCAEENYTKCEECGDLIGEDDDIEIHGADGAESLCLLCKLVLARDNKKEEVDENE